MVSLRKVVIAAGVDESQLLLLLLLKKVLLVYPRADQLALVDDVSRFPL